MSATATKEALAIYSIERQLFNELSRCMADDDLVVADLKRRVTLAAIGAMRQAIKDGAMAP